MTIHRTYEHSLILDKIINKLELYGKQRNSRSNVACSKCAPLVKSLKTLNIDNFDITNDKAQRVLNKNKLNGVTLQGV